MLLEIGIKAERKTENLLWTQQGLSLILPNTTNLALCQTVIPANVIAAHWPAYQKVIELLETKVTVLN